MLVFRASKTRRKKIIYLTLAARIRIEIKLGPKSVRDKLFG